MKIYLDLACMKLSEQTCHLLLLGLPLESPSNKMQAVLKRQKGVMVPGVPCVNRGNWG